MIIRPASIDDAASCSEIYAPYVTNSWVSFETVAPDASEMAGRIRNYNASHGWMIAEVDGDVAGFAYASPHRVRAAYSTSADVAVYVGNQYSRTGIGTALYTYLFPLLREKGFHAVFAGIALPNDASVALHRSIGFTHVGIFREVGWKLDSWRDVGWWQCLL